MVDISRSARDSAVIRYDHSTLGWTDISVHDVVSVLSLVVLTEPIVSECVPTSCNIVKNVPRGSAIYTEDDTEICVGSCDGVFVEPVP